MKRVLAIADDLTGAVEAGAALSGNPFQDGRLRYHPEVTLSVSSFVKRARDQSIVSVIDTDTRNREPAQAVRDLRQAVSAAFQTSQGTAPIYFKKIDSLFRGNTVAEIRELASGNQTAIAPALPHEGRTVANGILRIANGAGTRPTTLALDALFAPTPTGSINLRTVRCGKEAVADAVIATLRNGKLPIFDATTVADLAIIADGLLTVPRLIPIGSAGLASAIGGRDFDQNSDDGSNAESVSLDRTCRHRRVTIVVGTLYPTSVAQVSELVRSGIDVVVMGADHGRGLTEMEKKRRLGEPFAVAIDPDSAVDETNAGESAYLLAHLLTPLIQNDDLILVGGDTSRKILDSLGESLLKPQLVIHPGAVLSLTGSGRVVVTRAGSYGGRRSLVTLLDAVIGFQSRDTDSGY